MADPISPYYPVQGAYTVADACPTLLPAGLGVADARILFVHAHPDDESTVTGATMGYYAAAGAQVFLVTATRGEMGEVIPAELAHLEVGRAGCTDRGEALGAYRAEELRVACQELGVREHIFLGQGCSRIPGAPVLYRDSGMVWGDDGRARANPQAVADCLTKTDPVAQEDGIAQAIEWWRPQVVVTYDHTGGYGHPDHVRVHKVVVAAVKKLAGHPAAPQLLWGIEGDPEHGDHRVQAVLDGSLERKRAAMAAHQTQVIITGDESFQFSNRLTQKISARETFRLLWAAENQEA